MGTILGIVKRTLKYSTKGITGTVEFRAKYGDLVPYSLSAPLIGDPWGGISNLLCNDIDIVETPEEMLDNDTICDVRATFSTDGNVSSSGMTERHSVGTRVIKMIRGVKWHTTGYYLDNADSNFEFIVPIDNITLTQRDTVFSIAAIMAAAGKVNEIPEGGSAWCGYPRGTLMFKGAEPQFEYSGGVICGVNISYSFQSQPFDWNWDWQNPVQMRDPDDGHLLFYQKKYTDLPSYHATKAGTPIWSGEVAAYGGDPQLGYGRWDWLDIVDTDGVTMRPKYQYADFTALLGIPNSTPAPEA